MYEYTYTIYKRAKINRTKITTQLCFNGNTAEIEQNLY